MDIAQAPYMRAAALDPAGLDAAIQDLGRKKPQSVVPADQLVQDANALLARGQVADAEREYTSILTRDQDSTPAHYSLGLIWETQEKAR